MGQHARLDTFAEIKAQHNIIDTHDYQTADPALFAAGDIVKGDKTVVYAVKPEKKPLRLFIII